MGHRLSKIYTKTGDKGQTQLGDGSKVDKDNQRVQTYGDVDELNSNLGLVMAHLEQASIENDNIKQMMQTWLIKIQHQLFNLGGELCIPGYEILTAEDTLLLEQQIDQMNEELNPLKEFILPSGSVPVSQTHVARCICRRAERQISTLQQLEPINIHGLTYLNRLSDFLFVLARYIAKYTQINEVYWQKEV